MMWCIPVLMVLYFAFAGYRRAKRAGLWSWSKFAFSLGFGVFEVVVITVPLIFPNTKSPYFWPAYIMSWVLAAVFFVLFIMKARRWKLPDGRASLDAERELTGGK